VDPLQNKKYARSLVDPLEKAYAPKEKENLSLTFYWLKRRENLSASNSLRY
jgi:hypothetical protein